MVLLDKYFDETDCNEVDLPPSYDTIASVSTNIDEKPRPSPAPTARPTAPPSSSTWLSLLPDTRTKQTRQTVISLIRDLVATTTTDNSAATPILASCASALSPPSFSTLLQQPTLEGHTPIYWAILNRHTDILPDMLQYAGPLNNACVTDIRLACLASGNQLLFGKLRRGELPFQTTLRADALVLGSTSADDINVHEVDGEAAFSASIKIRLWQKRMRVAGLVGVEFIARGRIWSLTFFSAPSPSPLSSSHPNHGAGSGPWQVALSLMEHSPPTFVDGRLVIDVSRPLSSSIPDSLSSESFSPTNSRHPSLLSTPVPTSPTHARPPVVIPLRSTNRLAHRTSDGGVFSVLELRWGGVGPRPPKPAAWSDEGKQYTNALIGVLSDDLGWDNTPHLTPDGTLHARLDARLEKAEGGSCIIC
ncbi:uncharacterized protein EDB93DRAFT_1120092 [Suillus bovinus]|uniref:uncharacterized protein n=1 Tax=Suillus bovinus TaxID=48563 RepID=UPI001B884D93|nr:uncharacterized protein EDB93DRAFT_1120092 [Suillus bovinus]KAG2158767.1 hypothetical protein EDB93DRAFT_1120092 [Suillus bovinus]